MNLKGKAPSLSSLLSVFFFLPVVAQPLQLFGALSYWILTWGNSAATFQPFSDGGIRALTPEDYSRCSVSTSVCVVVLRARCECRLPPSRNQHGGNRGVYCFIFLDLRRQRTTEPCSRGSVLSLLRDIKCAIVISNHFYVFGCLLLCRYFFILFQLQFLAFFLCHIVVSNFFTTLGDLVKHFLVPPLTFADWIIFFT